MLTLAEDESRSAREVYLVMKKKGIVFFHLQANFPHFIDFVWFEGFTCSDTAKRLLVECLYNSSSPEMASVAARYITRFLEHQPSQWAVCTRRFLRAASSKLLLLQKKPQLFLTFRDVCQATR